MPLIRYVFRGLGGLILLLLKVGFVPLFDLNELPNCFIICCKSVCFLDFAVIVANPLKIGELGCLKKLV